VCVCVCMCVWCQTHSSTYTTVYTEARKTYRTITVYSTFFLKTNPQVRNSIRHQKIKNQIINLRNVHFVGLYFIITIRSSPKFEAVCETRPPSYSVNNWEFSSWLKWPKCVPDVHLVLKIRMSTVITSHVHTHL